jgi:tetratricopeptide (TPR) repeat protein
VLRRFEEDPSGRQFLPLSDVLRNHKLLDESMELLAQGVQDHPGFSVARVVLARELFQRGLLVDAWTILDRAPSPLTDNVLAQKLKYKLAILLGDESSARSAFQYLNIQQGIDPEIRKISQQLDLDGILVARETYQAELVRRGVDLRLPHTSSKMDRQREVRSESVVDGSRTRSKRFVLEFELDDALRRQVDQFQVVPLVDVFVAGSPSTGNPSVRSAPALELDSTTLADIYAKQGFYAKSLAIYQRILKMAPHNDMIRMKVTEMERLNREQRNEDFEVDPATVEKIEVVEIIDRQIRFLNQLLERIDQL